MGIFLYFQALSAAAACLRAHAEKGSYSHNKSVSLSGNLILLQNRFFVHRLKGEAAAQDDSESKKKKSRIILSDRREAPLGCHSEQLFPRSGSLRNLKKK